MRLDQILFQHAAKKIFTKEVSKYTRKKQVCLLFYARKKKQEAMLLVIHKRFNMSKQVMNIVR